MKYLLISLGWINQCVDDDPHERCSVQWNRKKKHFIYLSQILIVLHLYLVLFVSKLAGQCDSKLITSFKLFVVDAKWIMMSAFVHLSSLQTVLLDRVSWSSHNQVEDKMM